MSKETKKLGKLVQILSKSALSSSPCPLGAHNPHIENCRALQRQELEAHLVFFHVVRKLLSLNFILVKLEKHSLGLAKQAER